MLDWLTQLPGESLFRKGAVICSAIVFLIALLVNTLTLAPTVTLVDSGELIVAAHSLGVGHPPGFPLYLILAHLASLVPLANIAERINFASALFAALACAILTLVVAELIATASYLAAPTRRRDKVDNAFGCLNIIVPAACAGLLLAFSHTLWSYATIAEVYTLNTFLILTVLFLMLRWRRKIVQGTGSTNEHASASGAKAVVTRYDTLLYTAAAVFGLALGVHHVTVALMLPGLAVLVYQTQGLSFFKSRRLLWAALVSFAALFAVYSYLPLAAAHKPIMNWGDPRSLHAIWAHITGKQYQLFFSFSPSLIGEQLPQLGRLLLGEFGPPWFPVALIVIIVGFVAAFRSDRPAFLLLLFIVLADLAYSLSYSIAEDKDAYYLPMFIAMTIAAGIGFQALLRWAVTNPSDKIGRGLIIVAITLVPLSAGLWSWSFNNRSHYFVAHDYVENIENTIETNGLLLTLDWQVASPMLYTREIEERRRDIKAVDLNLLRRSWYFDYLRRSYPDLIERSRNTVDPYLALLKQWEHNPAAYRKSAELTQEIASAFSRMVQSFVTQELKVAPVYVTAEIILMDEEGNRDLLQWMRNSFQAVPKGLVFQLTDDTGFHDPGVLRLQTRGLIDGTLQFDDNDVVKLKVIPTYRRMLQSRGQYFTHFNLPERAAAAFQAERAFAPRVKD